MNPRPRLRLMAWLSACLIAIFPATGLAVSPDDLVVAFQNIRSDNVPGNAIAACDWIVAHRDELTPQLLEELYRTDRQGRDVILYALMRTKGYNPDARFCQTIISRLGEEDHFVRNLDLGAGEGVHWYAWTYMDRRYDLFKPLLLANLQTTNDMLTIWGTTTLLQKHGDLATEEPKFPQHVWDTAAVSLKPDTIAGNAGQAVRFYLLVGPDALPHLKPLATADDPQTRSLVAATIDAMGGSKSAYGYLAMHVCVGRNLFHHFDQTWPQWLDDEAYKWSQQPDSTPYQAQAP